MVDSIRILLLFFTIGVIQIATSISRRNLPDADLIVDVEKGYALERIGKYSPKLDEQLVHTFVSLNDVCVSSPAAEVCAYATGSPKSNMLELITVLARRSTLTSLDKDSVSRFIGRNLSQSLIHHRPEGKLDEFRTLTHVINDESPLETNDETVLPLLDPSNNGDVVQQQQQQQGDQQIPRFSQTAPAAILTQLSKREIGFDFMTNNQMKAFLTAVFLTIDKSYVVSNTRESLAVFQQLTIAQSIFALRYCSLNQQQSKSQRPCLVVSTLFLRSPPDSASTYLVYRLILFPIAVKNNLYVYSDVPKIVGVNFNQQSLIRWDDASDIDQCSFSVVVQCPKLPLAVSFANSPCLSRLFDDEMTVNDRCQVTRSPDTQPGVTEIANGLWLFSNVPTAQSCQAFSTSNNDVETIIIREESVVLMPCDKTIVCFGNQLPPTMCVKRRLAVIPMLPAQIQPHRAVQVPIGKAKNRLLSAYKTQSVQNYQDMQNEFKEAQSFLKRMLQEFGYSIFSVLITILAAVVIYILKYLQRTLRMQSDLETLHEVVHDMLLE